RSGSRRDECQPDGMSTDTSIDEQLTARLLRERIVVLGQQVDDPIANRICGQLLLLSAEDPERDITFYINSPGGSVSAGMRYTTPCSSSRTTLRRWRPASRQAWGSSCCVLEAPGSGPAFRTRAL